MKEWQIKAASGVLRMIKKSYIENNGLLDCWVYYLENMSRTMFFICVRQIVFFLKKQVFRVLYLPFCRGQRPCFGSIPKTVISQ